MIRTWKLTNISTEEMYFADMASLDAIARQLPEGYYSTFRTFEGGTRVLGLTAHLRRLYAPVATPEVSAASLRQQLRLLLDLYRPGEARVRTIMTRQGQSYIAIEPLKPLPREVYEKGVGVETTELQRENPRLKSTVFIGASDLERRHIAQEGIFEALLVKNGKILEGMTSNFFYVQYPRVGPLNQRGSASREPILCTARTGILLGVTRKTVIDLAQARGLPVKYRPLKHAQFEAVDEAFITSSSRGIVPVVQIDKVTIGQGSPGPVTQQLLAAYEAYVIEKAERI
ncbi:MAG TPA: aminotransferase class IV [Anaerolineales bacterium]|nr:aminotransferase class IV [Anaerolineales bacterium]